MSVESALDSKLMELQAAVSEHLTVEVLGGINKAEEDALASLVVGSHDTL